MVSRVVLIAHAVTLVKFSQLRDYWSAINLLCWLEDESLRILNNATPQLLVVSIYICCCKISAGLQIMLGSKAVGSKPYALSMLYSVSIQA